MNGTNPQHQTPPSATTSLADEGMDLAFYWRVIKRHKLSIFCIMLTGLILGILIAQSVTPIYKAKATLRVDPTQPSIDSNNKFVSSALVSLFYETQYEIIRSHNIAQKAVDRLNLVAHHKVNYFTQFSGEKSTSLLQQVTTWWQPSDTPELIKIPSDDVLRATLARNIRANLNVEGGKKSEIIRISYEDPDPKFSANVINAIAEAYVEFGLESRLSGNKQSTTWLSDQLQGLEVKLRKSEDALQIYQKEQGMLDTLQQERLAGTRLSTLTTELTQAQIKRSEAEIRHNQINNKFINADYASLIQVLSNRSTQAREQEVTKAARQVQELSERYGEKYPQMIAARSDLKKAERNLKATINQVVESVRKEYIAALDHEIELKALIKETKRGLSDIKGSSFKLARLEREVLNNQKLYESLLRRFQEANVYEQYNASNIYIIDAATPPEKAFKPNKSFIVAISVVIGFFIGLLFAFLRENLNSTFKTTKELEAILKLPALGITPQIKSNKKSAMPLITTSTNFRFIESISNIRTRLLLSNSDSLSQVISITSAISMEGKSTLAINLAASLSQLDRTLLLEVDLRKPSIAGSLAIKPTPGLTDLFLNKSFQLNDVVRCVKNNNEKFYVLTAGSLTSNPLKFLSSKHFSAILEELKKVFTFIIIDTPPILAVSDALIVSRLADSVIFAVKSESTKIQMSQEAISRLRKTNANIVGTILCQTDTKKIGNSESQYHHYSDTSYYISR